ncbi:hypothetical protein SAMN02746073_0664 [Legionella jamestowniensis DSM 19215]|uniref:Uncharacterized protein n=1 Tax=Legionella jamestowniensis TaxID=455 RepID=A0A0W0UKU6_9GAMM|nr:hypothetical protein Ljam_2721 [Legionella jamestowniensis]SFL52417.1 hypothetical protein SAMN02746073_0664 [Legionella jamestowniensis DSM 19215]
MEQDKTLFIASKTNLQYIKKGYILEPTNADNCLVNHLPPQPIALLTKYSSIMNDLLTNGIYSNNRLSEI